MKTSIISLEERIDLVKDWLLNSGIQSAEGGFYAWQDMDDDSHPYLYSEITGYAITTMCFLFSITKERAFINSAQRAAQWILQDALDASGGVLTRKYVKDAVEHYSFERGNIYSFDCGMVAFGMLKLYQATGEAGYLDCAENIIKFLEARMSKPDGSYYPVFDTKKDAPEEATEKWSTQSGSFHNKLALCLCELAAAGKNTSYKARAKKLIDSSVLNFRKGNGFVTSALDGTSHLHPYSYTLEGMLYYAYKTKDDSFQGVIEEAFGWMCSLQDKDGGFPTQVFTDGRALNAHKRSDIQAQVLRLSYFIRSGALYRERLLEYLLQAQNVSEGRKGAFLFGTDEKGVSRRHCNAWCSMFALQALYLASGKINSDRVMEYMI